MITLTLTEDEARLLLRALKERSAHLSVPRKERALIAMIETELVLKGDPLKREAKQ